VGAVLWVAAGGAIGAVTRHGVNIWSSRLFGPGFPLHTLIVNAVGCFLMGLLFGSIEARWQISDSVRLFLATGLLGGFTTFSAFSLDAFQLLQRGSHLAAGTYVVGSVALSLAGVACGFALSRGIA
jgi:fluoride exporter